jgi:purine-binding chemotaxis protein CheW
MTGLPATLCTFRLDGLRFGVDVARVQEVLRHQVMTRVPLAPPAVTGLLNLRGRIVPALDLRRCLGLRERETGERPVNVVVVSESGPVSLLVDEIGDVLALDPALFEEAPATVQGRVRELIRGACKLDDGLVLVLDVERSLVLEPGPEKRERR